MSSSPPPPPPAPATPAAPPTDPTPASMAEPDVDPPEPSTPAGNAAADMPLTMAQSVILTSLPRDTTEALSAAGNLEVEKVTIRFHAIGSAPVLRQKQFKLSASQRFETVVRFLKKRLEKMGTREGESVFCYINNVFSPGLDEGVGNLWRCFKVNEELVVHYSLQAAFG